MTARRLLAIFSVALLGGVAASLVGASAAGLDVSSQLLTDFSSSGTVDTTRCTLTSGADTYADQSSSAANFGSETQISVRSGDTANMRALVRFDLSTCSIPQSASVQSAVVQLSMSDAPDESRVQGIHRVTESWAETSATWDSQPGFASTETGSTSTGSSAGVWVEWTVTDDVASFVDGSSVNEGWLVKDDSEGALTAGLRSDYRSREHGTTAEHPTLVIDYYP